MKKMWIKNLLLVFSVTLFFCICDSSGCLASNTRMLLTKTKKTNQAIIVLYHKSSPIVKFAAEELKKYLNQIASGSFNCLERDQAFRLHQIEGPKILLVSSESIPPWFEGIDTSMVPLTGAPDLFVIKTFDSNATAPKNIDTLLIAGATDRALLFGVYDFLERLGCRWLGPGEEHVPKVEYIKISPLDISEAPGMKLRTLVMLEPRIPLDQYVDWHAKMKMNVCWPAEYEPEWGTEGRGSYTRDVSEESMKKNAIPEMIKRGLNIYWGEHIISGSHPVLFPVKKYTKSNPEYFAMLKGIRLDPNQGYKARNNLCYSNPQVIPILQEETVKFLRNHPWIKVLLIWPNEASWCDCPPCRAMESNPDQSRSATYYMMIKAVSTAVSRQLPGRKIMFAHLYNFTHLPVNRKGEVLTDLLPPTDATIAQIDLTGQCIRHPFNDPDCRRHNMIKGTMDEWKSYGYETICYTYYWQGSYMKGMPIGIAHKISQDVNYVKSLGMNGMSPGVGAYNGQDDWNFNVLNFYVYAKAMWNPDIDVDATIKDFCRYYYGPAAEPMDKFWKLIEQSWSNFGLHPDFIPDDEKLAANPRHFHGRWKKSMNIKWLIPNHRVFEQLDNYLHEARHMAASAYNPPPMKLYGKTYAEYMPYVTRIQLLERFISFWPTSPWTSDGRAK